MTQSKLLLPASLATYKAAVQAGADEIYLGTEKFGARSYADNFNMTELEQAVDYCHLRNTAVHLTMNTLVKKSEMKEFAQIAEKAMNIGVDAFIVQDIAAAEMLIKAGAEVHASTQLTVHNAAGAEFAREFGFSRVVLSREMTEDEIKKITDNCDIETEIFVHGALCMCYSGQCLMSSIIGGRSANRGKCAQPCRLPYKFMKNGSFVKQGYFLNPYDLSLADVIDRVSALNITSLKIEGRMKGKEYVAAAASEYRSAIDNGTFDEDVLKAAFCRGGRFTHGGFAGEKGKKIISYARGNNDVYEIRDVSKLEKIKPYTAENANIRKSPVDMKVYVIPEREMSATLKCGNCEIKVCGAVAETAQKRPLKHEDVEKSMNKTGDVPFYIKNIEVVCENAFATVSSLNELRRNAFDMLSRDIVNKSKKSANIVLPEFHEPKRTSVHKTNIWVRTKEQLEAVGNDADGDIFVPLDIYGGTGFCIIPDIVRNTDYYINEIKRKNIRKIACGNLGIVHETLKMGLEVYLTYSANVFSHYTEQRWLDMNVCGMQISPELSLKELDFSEKSSVIVYGKLIMMKTANCPSYTVYGKCGQTDGTSLTDRKNESFAMSSDCRECVTYIYNSKPVYMADKLHSIRNVGAFDIVFTDETPEMCRKIIELYKAELPCPFEFTRGHFTRGVM